jgi:mono/diheme cytochrome c family protein
VPFDNPYRALFFCAGHDFFKNGDAALCTVHGDVWRISGVDAGLARLVWKRYATGLYQPLGLRIVDDKVYVLGRDQITRLHDANGDGEADYYENFCNHGRTSPGGHDYSTCLETDAAGNFYFLTALEGLVRVSRDGKQRTVVASGFRNPNGLGIGPGDVITVAPQEGEWTPASHIAEARPGSYHGFGGPRAAAGRPLGYNAPLCWIPRRHDNSSGGQVWTPPAWGPLGGQMLHFSYGQCRALLVLRELLSSGTVQGGSVDLPLTFASGAMRGRFSPHDGQLYVSGLKGWVSSAAQDGCLQRVRYTGRPADLPVRVETLANGLAVTFSRPLDRSAAEDPGSYHLEQWNYKYSASYGSADYKVSDPRQEGHDEVKLASATLLADGRTVFLEVPSVQPVMQLAVRYSLHSSDGRPLRHTIHYTINEVGRRRMEPSPGSRPPAPLVDESKLNPGLIARFEQAGRRDARTSRLAALFVAAQDAPTPFLDPGPFAVRFEGFVRASLRGDVELTLRGRGDAVLHVHGKEVLRASGDLSAAAPARVTLFRGVNPISLEYRAPDTGAANVRLFWQGDDFHAEPVPPTALVHGAHDAPLQAALDLRRGRDLFAERHCGQCHREPEAPARDAVIPRLRFGLPPDLASVGARLTANWLAHCLLDPTAVDPDATMPRLLVKAQVQQAADLAAHLSSRSSTIAPPATEAGDVALGARLYEELNCLSCHRFTRPTTTDTYQRRSLYHVDAKYRPGMLAAYLRQPYAHHPAGRMPDFHLNEPEAAALATYLRREARGKLPELDAGDARRGAQLYRELRCGNCHPAGTEQGDSVARLRFGSDEPRGGCVGAQPAAPVPDLHLEEVDRRALQTFLRSDGRSLTRRVPAEEAAHLVRMLNCTACHARDSTVSPRAELVAEEGSGLVPEPLPALTWTGDKLRASWLEAYLAGKHPQRLRPMLSTRMPAFPAYAAALAAGIAAEHGVDAREPAPAGFDAAQAETGAELVRPAALDCRQCHAIANEPLAGDAKTQLAVGIPFIHVRQRLRHEFYQRFVVDPPRYDLASKMPKLLADGRRTKVTSIHNGDARRQLDAIWHFILSAELVAAPDDKKPSGGR